MSNPREFGKSVIQEFFLNEAEGGTPPYSSYDVGLASMRAFPNNQILPFEPTGTTKGSKIFPNVYGVAARGMGSVQPSPITKPFYFGGYPLSNQPTINKPNPWEDITV